MCLHGDAAHGANGNDAVQLGSVKCIKRPGRAIIALAISLGLALANAAVASADDLPLLDLSLEELASIQVISVSKSEQSVSEAPASIYVITEQAIHRSGVTTLPEALRLAPNLQVARSSAGEYAITARGFNSSRANKMLVMIDGRTVYSSLFSGVFWDAQEVVLEDVDRIEVVSGPGGSVWGANAVNGVINIITQSADDTQGPLLSFGASDIERQAVARYGSTIGQGHYRVYGKYSQHDDALLTDGTSADDGLEHIQTGFRMDWDSDRETATLQGDAYSGRKQQVDADAVEFAGANLLGRKQWRLSPDSAFTLQAYFDHTRRDQPSAFRERLNTFDLDLQYEWKAGDRHSIVSGGGFRYARDRVDNREELAFLPEDVTLRWSNLFLQDAITLDDKLKLVLGVKLEENPFTGWEAMPNVNLSWQPDTTSLYWTSVSRAVRSPSRVDTDFFGPGDPPVVNGVPQYTFAGGPDFQSEVVDIFELGYRGQPSERLSWSATAFYSEYDDLRSLAPNTTGTGFVFANGAEAESYGIELWGTWQVRPNWRLHGGMFAQELDLSLQPGNLDLSGTPLATADPDYQILLRSAHDISDELVFNATFRHVDELEAMDVPAYTALDLRLGWTLRPDLEFSLVGQNLFDDQHPEFGTSPGRSEFRRAIYGKFIWTP